MASENGTENPDRSARNKDSSLKRVSVKPLTWCLRENLHSPTIAMMHQASGHAPSRHKTAVNARFSASVPLYLMRPSLSLSILALFANFAYGFSSPPPAKPLRVLGRAHKLVGHHRRHYRQGTSCQRATSAEEVHSRLSRQVRKSPA